MNSPQQKNVDEEKMAVQMSTTEDTEEEDCNDHYSGAEEEESSGGEEDDYDGYQHRQHHQEELSEDDYWDNKEEEEDDYDDDDDDDDDDNPFWMAFFYGAWKEHAVAIGIALVAASVTFWYQQPTTDALLGGSQSSSSLLQENGLLLAPTLNQDIAVNTQDTNNFHPHLESYIRTANVSFCPGRMAKDDGGLLRTMDFFLPVELIDAMKQLYVADEAQDNFYQDFYQQVQKQQEQGSVEYIDPVTHIQMIESNAEYSCLVQQEKKLFLPATSSQSRQLEVGSSSSRTGGNNKRQTVRGMTHYYQPPTLEEMYPEDAKAISKRSMSLKQKLNAPPLIFTGFAVKFVNLSPRPILLYWDGKGGHAGSAKLVGEIPPMESLGTATMPGHSFSVTPIYDSSHALQRWVVTVDAALVLYEPLEQDTLYQELVETDREKSAFLYFQYQLQKLNEAFARDYMVATQRTWLGQFPRRFPVHPMHAATYMGQRHAVSASATPNENDDNDLKGTPSSFSLEVVSVSPRVFTIDNFMTIDECEQLKSFAMEQGMHPSTLHTGGKPAAEATRDSQTRSSSNAWLSRQHSNLTNSLYQRAATVLGVDERLLQGNHDEDGRYHSIAESIQVVHYNGGGEEYQAHHDFVYPSVTHRYQPTRFATLLVYLNSVTDGGGATRFPRAVNKEKAEGIEVQPQQGRAVLFYNLLPDGNVDDLSQHGSNPTHQQEKWMANIWVWDPMIN